MAEPAANDYSAIRKKMEANEAERRAVRNAPCPDCSGVGWTRDVPGYGIFYQCPSCGNPQEKLSP